MVQTFVFCFVFLRDVAYTSIQFGSEELQGQVDASSMLMFLGLLLSSSVVWQAVHHLLCLILLFSKKTLIVVVTITDTILQPQCQNDLLNWAH